MRAEDIIAREKGDLKVDCKPGCSWCCNQLVVLTNEADGKVILDTAKERTSAEEFSAIVRKVKEQAREISALPYQVAEERSWPCPLLKNKRCLVYEVRPIACQSVFSPDSKCCKAMLQANSYDQLPGEYREIATGITERAMRIQLSINNSRPIDGAFELRSLLVSILEREERESLH